MTAKLQKVFLSSFDEFLENEAQNILNGVSERNLCGRLAKLIEEKAHTSGFDEYFADIEYNRKQDGQVKTIIDENMEVVSITPDIILHSRGKKIKNDNLIAVEMKRKEHLESEKRKDRNRLCALTKSSEVWSYDGKSHPEHVYGYSLGYFLELDINSQLFRIEEYRQGKLAGSLEKKFRSA